MTVPKLLFCTRLGAQSQWVFSLSWLFDEGRLELLRDTLRSPLAHFPWFCWQYYFFPYHYIFNTFSQKDVRTSYCVRVLGIFFNNFSIVALLTKSNRRLQKTMAIFLNFDWFLVVSFVFSANQKLFVICTRVTEELYSFLSQSELGNFSMYIISFGIPRVWTNSPAIHQIRLWVYGLADCATVA